MLHLNRYHFISESCREWISWTLKSKWRAMQSEDMSFPKDNSALTCSFRTTVRECLINIWRFSRYRRVLTQMPSQSKWQLYKGHILDHFQREKLSCEESFHKTAGLCFIMWPHFQGFCEYCFHEPKNKNLDKAVWFSFHDLKWIWSSLKFWICENNCLLKYWKSF